MYRAQLFPPTFSIISKEFQVHYLIEYTHKNGCDSFNDMLLKFMHWCNIDQKVGISLYYVSAKRFIIRDKTETAYHS